MPRIFLPASLNAYPRLVVPDAGRGAGPKVTGAHRGLHGDWGRQRQLDATTRDFRRRPCRPGKNPFGTVSLFSLDVLIWGIWRI